jgi:hypothetical protein
MKVNNPLFFAINQKKNQGQIPILFVGKAFSGTRFYCPLFMFGQ